MNYNFIRKLITCIVLVSILFNINLVVVQQMGTIKFSNNSSYAAEEGYTTVYFEDEILYRAMKNQEIPGQICNDETQEITYENIEEIAYMEISLYEYYERIGEFYSINGLEKFTGLKALSIPISKVTDFSPISKLTSLETLYMDDEYFIDFFEGSDLSRENRNIENLLFLENLSNLETLRITRFGLESISGIENATLLKVLDINPIDVKMELENLNALQNLTGLLQLSMNNVAKIEDISGISGLTNLRALELSGVQRTNVEELQNLTKLYYLRIENSKTENINGITDLTDLSDIYINGTNITQIPDLSRLTKLSRLDLWNNKIEDISGIRNLPELTDLTLSKNNISDISTLVNLPKLEWLFAYSNKITNIDVLGELTSLRYLNLSDNNIEDLSILESLENLENLFLANTGISSLDNFPTLLEVYFLDLSDNNITDLNGIERLIRVQSLDLQGNHIVDFSPLENLSFVRLSISNYDDTDLTTLENVEIYPSFFGIGLTIYDEAEMNIEWLQGMLNEKWEGVSTSVYYSLEEQYFEKNQEAVVPLPQNFILAKTQSSSFYTENEIDVRSYYPYPDDWTQSHKAQLNNDKESIVIDTAEETEKSKVSASLCIDDDLYLFYVFDYNVLEEIQQQYTISFDLNGGGTNTIAPKSGIAGATITLPTKYFVNSVRFIVTCDPCGGTVPYSEIQAPARFKAWNTKSDGSGTSYAGGADYTINGDATLYLEWEGSSSYIDGNIPERSGFKFLGWYTQPNGGGTKVDNNYMVDSDMTVYAHWQEDQEESGIKIESGIYTVDRINKYIFVPKAKTTLKTFIENIDTNASTDIPNPKKQNYIGTGMKLVLTKGTDTETYTVVVMGDLDGDGIVTAADLLGVKRHMLSKSKSEWVLKDIQFKAADLGKNGNIDAGVLLEMKRMILGISQYGK